MKQLLIIVALFFSLTASSQQIVLKVEGGILVQDTAAMMAGYLRSATASGLYLPIGRLADSTAALRTWVNAGFPAMQRFLDSIAAVRGAIGTGGSGSVTSVGMTVPTGLQVANSPITSTGTLAVTFQSGYSIPTTAKQTQWDAAYNASTLNSYLLNPVAVTNYDSLLFRKNDSVAVVKLFRAFAGSNKVTVSKTVNDTSLAYSIDVAEANLTLGNLGGTLANSKLANMAANTIKGNNTGSSSAPIDLTVAQTKTMLALNNVDNTSDATKNSATATLTNKRWVARVGSTTSSATPTINTDNVDIYKLTAQAANITSFTTNLTGTPNDGDILEIQITGTASRTISWGASFVASTVALPTTTSGTATLTVIFQYYTTSSYGNNVWVCVNSY